jgi:hypothetical protein
MKFGAEYLPHMSRLHTTVDGDLQGQNKLDQRHR